MQYFALDEILFHVGQYFAVMLACFIRYKDKVVFTFESVDEILSCDNSNESYRAVPIRTVLISQFQVAFTLTIKARLSAKCYYVFIHMQTKLIFIWIALHLASLS